MVTALEIHAHYSKLFEAFAVLPTDDIGFALREHAWDLWSERPWNEFGQFLDRIESYLEQSRLSPERIAEVGAFLATQKPRYERRCWMPEERPYLLEWDRPDLKFRRLQLEGYLRNFEQTPEWKRERCYAPSVGSVLLGVIKQVEPPLPSYTSIAQWDFSIWKNLSEHRQSLEKSQKEVERRLALLDSRKEAPAVTAPPAVSPFAPLLLNYTLAELTALLTELSLIDTHTGREALTATPGGWAGIIHALLNGREPRLRGGSNRAIQRAFTETFGAKVSERTAQGDLGKRGSVAEQFRDRALSILNR